jgi:hypothetical protein
MMGKRAGVQAALFYEFDLDRHVPGDHLLRSIDRFVDLSGIRARLRPFYSAIGRPSIDPELMIRMLIIGSCCGIRSERRLCEEVQIKLAEHVIEAIQAIPEWQNQKWLFGTRSCSNVSPDLNKAIDKAGVPHCGTHTLGRHKAARNLLRAGESLPGAAGRISLEA